MPRSRQGAVSASEGAVPVSDKARRTPHHGVAAAAALWCFVAACWYFFLLTRGTGQLTAPGSYGLTFNSMLLHLLQGRFDVDPDAVGAEGYLGDGAVYAYFGIFPALFRCIFLPLRNFATTDFTTVSCLTAVCVMAVSKAMTAVVVWRRAGSPERSRLVWLMLVAILASGPQIQFLRPSIYQETITWAGAFAAVFVFLVVRGWIEDKGFTPGLLALAAVAAGFCLLTRVSTALGLYLALGLIWLRVAWLATRPSMADRRVPRLLGLMLSALILVGFAVAKGFVTFERWGNPLVFADLSHSIMAMRYYPDRLLRVQEYGEFNPARLAYGLGYYFLPVWVLHDGSGQLLWSGFAQRMIDSAELPPSSFFITDPLLIGLAGYGIVGLVRDRSEPRREFIALAGVGLVVPIFLMLTAISMTFRYRMEFYPLFELLAFVGFARLAAPPNRRATTAVAVATFAGILSAHAVWMLYMLSPFGPAWRVLGQTGVVAFYRSLLP